MMLSRKFNENQHNGKSGNRLEFSEKTRKLLAASAGYKCAIRRCLAPSTCKATKKNGTAGSANFGRASHIYAASPNGPRQAPPEMTPENITDTSNGIWTCGSCSIIIDTLECDYSPAQLAEMKRVREAAERMAASDPEIRGISRYISPIAFDEVFWSNLPDFDEHKIRPALLEIAAREMQKLAERSRRDVSTPSHLPRKPLASAINTMINDDGDAQFSLLNTATVHPYFQNPAAVVDHTPVYRRAAEIVGAWAEWISSLHWSGTDLHIHHVNILITVRHPQTKVLCESPIRAMGYGYGRNYRAADEGDILHMKVRGTTSVVNNLSWQLNVDFEKGKFHAMSTLSLAGRISPPKNYNAQWDEEFASYEKVLRKLAEGWQPVGFIGMSPSPSPFENRMYPEAFDIELQISASELDECLYRCRKIRLAFALERQWGWWFKFTEVYFERCLDLTIIQAASDELRERLGPPPYWYRGESLPLVSVGNRDIKFVAKNGIITFISVLRSSFERPLTADHLPVRSDSENGC